MNNRAIRPWGIVLTIACILPACEGFTCSQERIKAIELANRGAEEFKNNLYDSAEKDLKQAIQTDPSYEIAYYNLGKVFQKQRKWDKAIESFEQAVRRWEFPKPLGGGIVIVSYPFVLTPAGGGE